MNIDHPPSFDRTTNPLYLYACCVTILLQCCFTSTETVRTITNEERRTTTSTFTQVLSSDGEAIRSMLLYVHRDRTDYDGRGAQDLHLVFHTTPERQGLFAPFCNNEAFQIARNSGPVLLFRVYSLISKPKENVRPR